MGEALIKTIDENVTRKSAETCICHYISFKVKLTALHIVFIFSPDLHSLSSFNPKFFQH